MSIKFVSTNDAPKAIGPYSQAIISGPFVFCSGAIPLNPVTMTIEATEVVGQTEQVFKNMEAILLAAGSSLNKVVKTTVFLKDMNDFQKMNGVYEKLFGGHKPARSTIQVAKLPMDCLVEIECVANI